MIESFFGENGYLSGLIDNYHMRPSQLELAEAIDNAIVNGTHLLAEAPTGTGKSMAYGVPAAIHALSHNETVVIATANITLQEQLFHKDLPLIAELMSDFEIDGQPAPPLRYLLMKGMGNYLCLDKLEELREKQFDEGWFQEISEWADRTETGDKSELAVEYPANEWSKVACSSDDCTKKNCEFFDKCHVMKLRTEGVPHIVVTNYHMLYTDILVRAATAGNASLLPPYDTLVLDEAHEAVDIAMDFNGFEITFGRVRWLANAMMKIKNPGADIIRRALLGKARSFFAELEKEGTEDILTSPLGYDSGLVTALLEAGDFVEVEAKAMKERAQDKAEFRTANRLRVLAGSFTKMSSEVREVAWGVSHEKDDSIKVLPKGNAYYIEHDRRRDSYSLCCKTVDVQDFMRAHIFTNAVVAVSATLATDYNFKFIAKELGLRDNEFDSKIVGSPFDPENMLVIIPKSVPQPKQRDQHTAAVAHVVERAATDLNGRTMALFTSYRALLAVDKHLRRHPRDFTILTQGELPKSRIISCFKEDPQSLILATASFWQGVDIPGEALSCLIIDKFPFAPPSDPVVQYLEGVYAEEGRSVFFDYSVPKAVIALKQGVGRLIRTETDFGVVILCDSRIEKTGYGKKFARAFPPGHFRSEDGSLDDIRAFIEARRR
jgi:ATP-dependent DNA helicase DinG